LHVVHLNYWYDSKMTSLEDVLAIHPSTAGWAESLHAAGAQVTVVQRFHRGAQHVRGGVRFVLVADPYPPHLRQWQISRSLTRALQQTCAETRSNREPTVVHFNGLQFPLHLRAARAALPPEVVIAVQHHAEKPWPGVRRCIQKLGLRVADGFFFAALDQAAPWREQGLISPHQGVYEVMEDSTSFRRADRALSRARTGVIGDPVVLWVGRLNALKDPLAVLRGFESVVRARPQARLYMVYGSEDLLPAVRDCLAGSGLLASSVTLLGRVPHPELEPLYNSADYFVLGSHYEGSGYSLAEAMACGVVPIVTDIPSFRAMTDGGKIGACWPPGDSAAFAEAFCQVSRQPLQVLSDRAARFFEENLSYPAIARKAMRAYAELAAKRVERKQCA